MAEVNLALKYRPSSFGGVVGQEVAVSTLRRIAQSEGMVCRAIFMKGSYGTGKTTLARLFGRAVNCSTFRATGELCGDNDICSGCSEAMSLSSSTYWELDGTMVGNADGIRGLSERLSVMPTGRRVVLLDEVQSITAQASNMLLKLVEEGVPDTIFVFAGTEDISATLRSRCLCLDINTIPMGLLRGRVAAVAKAEGISITDGDLEVLCLRSNGHLRDALSMLQHYGLVGADALASSYDTFRKFVTHCIARDARRAPQRWLDALLLYPIVDIQMSVGLFIRNLYLAKAEDKSVYSKLAAQGMGKVMMQFFFSPIAQTALRSEVGCEILLRSFMDKFEPRDNGE